MSLCALPAGYRLEAYDSLGSTNDTAIAAACGGAPGGLVVTARRQLAGRGRHGRQWDSPEGNLYCSVLLRPDCPVAVAAQLSFVAAVALAESLAAYLPQPGRIGCKWPNDILHDGAKLAGILIESHGSAQGTADWVVIGCGVNLTHHPADTPYPATHMRAAGATICPGTLLGEYVRMLDIWYGRWKGEGFAPVRAAWLERACYLGEEMIARAGRQEWRGIFEGLSDDGAIRLRLADGGRRLIAAGEVFPAT